MARIIPLEQGTREWFLWRLDGIGGSDIAAILGSIPLGRDKPYCTMQELMAEKCGAHDRDENFAMRRGRRLEPEARYWYEQIHGVKATPCCVEHVFEPWIRASLDGLVEEHKVLEIKAPKAIDHDFALNGLVPPCYRAQLQWEMLATGVELCDYFSYNPSKKFSKDNQWACVEVKADFKFQQELTVLAQAFWEIVLHNRREMAA